MPGQGRVSTGPAGVVAEVAGTVAEPVSMVEGLPPDGLSPEGEGAGEEAPEEAGTVAEPVSTVEGLAPEGLSPEGEGTSADFVGGTSAEWVSVTGQMVVLTGTVTVVVTEAPGHSETPELQLTMVEVEKMVEVVM